MPLNVRRFCTSVLLVFLSFITLTLAQAPTSGDVMRERISRAKAFIAVRNYNAAIFELESIRKETSDQSVHAVTNVLLMNSYLEQGDYKRAQDFLSEFYKSYKSNNAHASTYYYAVAGQIIRGARNRADRYRALGLNVADRNLPLEAANDLEKMRETLELVVTQSKEIGTDKAKAANAIALLEEASNSRSLLARDDYDAVRWKNEIGDAREQLAQSRSVVMNAVASDMPADNLVAQNTAPQATPVSMPVAAAPTTQAPVFKPVEEADAKRADPQPAPAAEPATETPKKESKPSDNEPRRPNVAPRQVTIVGKARKDEAKKAEETKPAETPAADAGSGPMDVGSLVTYATKQSQPVYPPAARNMRTTGVVKVEVTVDENGDVAEVQKSTGPTLLQSAAKDAIKRWKFKPFVRDGQPVKATGFVNFNFSL